MPDGFSSCFGGCAAEVQPPSMKAGPNLTTSIYGTRLGITALTWSRSFLGLTLDADLHLSGEDDEALRFRIRPWLLWKRRGSRRFRLREHPCHRCVDFAWDLSRARFQTGGRDGGRPEPASGFFVTVAVDGEMLFVAGDLVEEAYRKSRARRPRAPFSRPAALTSRREHVVLGDPGGRRSYCTLARFGGRDREISIDLGSKESEPEAGMSVEVDGERVLHVRRLQWKFRGTEKVEIEGEGESCGRMQVSWDLHDWLFQSKDDPAMAAGASATVVPAAAERGRAIFLFRFEPDEEEAPKPAEEHIRKVFDEQSEGHFWNGVSKGTALRNWSASSSNGADCRAETLNRRRRHHRRKSLLKTSSSCSSTSSMSSASSSTVTDWASQEEEELQRQDGFSLLVYITKS